MSNTKLITTSVAVVYAGSLFVAKLQLPASTPLPWVAAAVIAALCALFIGVPMALAVSYVRIARALSKQRQGNSRRLARQENIHVPTDYLDQQMHNLGEGENEVHWLDRKSRIAYIPLGVFLLLLAVLVVVSSIIALTTDSVTISTLVERSPGSGTSGNNEYNFDYLWVFGVAGFALSFLLVLLVWNSWLNWQAIYRMITNQNLVFSKQPWQWAFWLWSSEEFDPLPLEYIIGATKKATFFGRYFGYGTIRVKTFLQEGEERSFQLRLVRDYEQFAAVLDRAYKARKRAQRGTAEDTAPTLIQ